MTRQSFIPGICILVLFAALLVFGCITEITDGTPGTTVPATLTTNPPDSPDCGLTPCHGLDITCGPEVSEVCTTVYQLGDKCRQFARCETDANKTCQMVTTLDFETCKSCVQSCLNESRNDPVKLFACEEKC